MIRATCTIAVLACLASQTFAQGNAAAPEGWVFQLESAYLSQGDSDLSSGSAFSAERGYLRLGAFNRRADGLSVGLSATLGQTDYDFDTAAPWGRIRENSLSLTFAGRNRNGMNWFVAPTLRERAETGAGSDDGVTAGAFAGVSWSLNDRLTIGPAIGAFEGVGSEDVDVFPALLLDWQISDRFSLTTGPTLGASQGPGLSLRYALDDDWGVTLSARRESNRFALSDRGATPGGAGEDTSVPVVVSLNYKPRPSMNFAVFAGAEFDGQLEVENAAGTTVRKESYDTVPLLGIAVSLAF
ncbi:hypothetical protein [Shimia sp.]|uniref:hypothetical protein n=1 Tax=Shimia sp. TaxID=1954381 RepID=UPI003BAB18BF